MNRQVYILVTVLLLLGCRASGGLPEAGQTSSLHTPDRVRATNSTRADGEAAAGSATASPGTTVGTGALTGVLLLRTEDGVQPVAEIKLAIGETLSDDEGTERVVAYDPSTAPITYTDASGRFVFEDLQSGRYGLILDMVLSSFLLYQEGTLNPILFAITDGETTDLGSLEYSELPLPQAYR